MDESKNRTLYFDAIKILAMLLVIYTHSGEYGAGRFALLHAEGGWSFYAHLTGNVVCQVAVPLFFMVSGALLLNKEESLLYLLRKRVFRFALVLVLFTVLQFAWRSCTTGTPFYISPAVNQILAGYGSISGWAYPDSYWFLYAYLVFLLFLPIHRKMVQNMAIEHFVYVLILSFLFLAILPMLCCLSNHGRAIVPQILGYTGFLGQWILYPTLGYFIAKRIPHSFISRRILLILGGASVLSVLIALLLTAWNISVEPIRDAHLHLLQKGFIIIPSCFIFVSFSRLFQKIDSHSRSGRFILFFSQLSLCVMLLEENSRFIIKNLITSHMHTPPAITSICYIFLSYFMACFIGAILRMLPGVKRIL